MSATREFDPVELEKELKRYVRWQNRIEEVAVDFADEPQTVKMMQQRFQMCLNLAGHNILEMARRDVEAAQEVFDRVGEELGLRIEC